MSNHTVYETIAFEREEHVGIISLPYLDPMAVSAAKQAVLSGPDLPLSDGLYLEKRPASELALAQARDKRVDPASRNNPRRNNR